jgi:hypothetical protein
VGMMSQSPERIGANATPYPRLGASWEVELRPGSSIRTARRQDAWVAARLTMTGVRTGASGTGARRAVCASRGKNKTAFVRKVKRLSFRAEAEVEESQA